MVELAEDSHQKLAAHLNAVNQCIDTANILYQVGFKSDEQQMQTLWKARNGVFPTIAAQRPNGSSVLIEDIAVNILDLPNLISDVKELFVKYNYTNAAIFGHVLAGNIHFVLTPNFNDDEQVLVYDNFMHEITRLVAKNIMVLLRPNMVVDVTSRHLQ